MNWTSLAKQTWPGIVWMETITDCRQAVREIAHDCRRRNQPEPTEAEMVELVRYMRGLHAGERFTPGIEEFSHYLRKMRQEKEKEKAAVATSRISPARMAELCAQIRAAKPEERWDMVCIPADSRDCDALREYALTLPGGAPRPAFRRVEDRDVFKRAGSGANEQD